MNGVICFICGETYYNDNETHVTVKRVECDGFTKKTTVWNGMVCDSCLHKHFGLWEEDGDDR